MAKRKQRISEFLESKEGTSVSFSGELLQSARCLLINSLQDRRIENWREAGNHYSVYAPGVIVMVAISFEAWLNEVIGGHRTRLSSERIKELVSMPVCDRYRNTAALNVSTGALEPPEDLRLLIAVRDEIVHALPYVQSVASKKTVPNRLSQLATKGLFIDAASPFGDFLLSQKLCSYALAYWGCQTAQFAAGALAATLTHNPAKSTATNFEFYRQMPGPSDFAQFDKRIGLTPTR